MGKLLSREDILRAQDITVERVEVPEWGGYVLVRGMTGAERDAFEQSIVKQRGKGKVELNLHNIRAKLVAYCCVDEAGNRLFTEADIEALGRKSGAALNRIYEVAQRLSGLTQQDMDELMGNSSSDQSDDSISG